MFDRKKMALYNVVKSILRFIGIDIYREGKLNEINGHYSQSG